MSPLKLALLNLWRRKFASAIVVFSIAVAVGTSGLLYRLYELSNSRFSTLAPGGDAVVGAKASGMDILLASLNLEGPYPGFLPYKLFASLRAKQQVHFEDGVNAEPDFIETVVPFLYAGQAYGRRVIGTDASFLSLRQAPHLKDGKWVEGANEIVVGARTAQDQNLTLGAKISVNPWVGGDPLATASDFKVSGILFATHTAWDHGLFISVPDAQALIAQADLSRISIWQNQVLNFFLLDLKPNGFMPLQALVDRRTVGQVISVNHEIERLRELTGSGRQLGLFISVFIMILGGLSVAGMMVTRFDALGPQVAVLRAIGYHQSHIAKWLLWEGILLSLSACVVGGVMDLALFPLLRATLGTTLPAEIELGIGHSAPVWGVAIVCTILAVTMPMWRLRRQDVHGLLRTQG